MQCPCQSSLEYAQCCEPYHTGKQHAPTAEAVMRSRYSAYALGVADYIISTTHRENIQYRKNVKEWRKEVQAYCRKMKFLGLEITESVPGEVSSTVTFKAKMSQEGTEFTMTEKSAFVKVGQRWLYLTTVPILQPGESQETAPQST